MVRDGRITDSMSVIALLHEAVRRAGRAATDRVPRGISRPAPDRPLARPLAGPARVLTDDRRIRSASEMFHGETDRATGADPSGARPMPGEDPHACFGQGPVPRARSIIAFVRLDRPGRRGSVTTRELDARVEKAIFQTINLGVQVYNRGDAPGCYRIYQGSLIALGPILAHRPDLQAAVQKGLAAPRRRGTYEQKAFALRAVLDDVRSKVHAAAARRSLWSRLGGEPAVKAVVHDFVVRAATDPKVDFTRGGRYPVDAAGVARLEMLLVQQISSVSGGPLKYTGRAMKPLHEGMGITDAQFGAMAGDLIAVLKSYKVPQKEIDELVGIIATHQGGIVERRRRPPAPPTPSRPGGRPEAVSPNSLWARLGGEPAVKAVVHDFVLKAATDPKVDFTRGGRYPLDAAGVARLEMLLVQQISSVSGGPLTYTGRDMKPSTRGWGSPRPSSTPSPAT